MNALSIPPDPTFPPAHLDPDKSITQVDASVLYGMVGSGYTWLKHHSAIVDALNVFPVPDGDTGANMVLTMQAAWKEAASSVNGSVDELMQALAMGAVRGARGNSGVILSQVFRGMAEQLRGVKTLDAVHLAGALQQGRDTAYKGVLKPVEGTILTVVREAATACGHAAAISSDLRFVLQATLNKAQEALNQTPNLLPVLKQAGVVDAGGQGFVYLWEGMLKYLNAEPVTSVVDVGPASGPNVMPQPDLHALEADEWGYDIQYLIYGEDLDETSIRQQLLNMGGESVVVGSAGSIIKVHVHHNDPGPFLSYGATLGHLDDIVLENMTLQTLRRKGQWHESGSSASSTSMNGVELEVERCREGPGVIAVVSGQGLRGVFMSLGVCGTVNGGQTMNPSTEELLWAAENLPSPEVILLPNNKNIIMAARQAAELAAKPVYVVETRSVPQGIAAILQFNAEASIAENVQAMTAAALGVRAAEVTTAVRAAAFDGVKVQEGDIIGLIDDVLRCKGDNPESVVQQLLTMLDPHAETELITLYYGQPVTAGEAQQLAASLRRQYTDRDVEVIAGGQPYYHYLISVE